MEGEPPRLGVESGPVVIAYRDYRRIRRRLCRSLIDTVPPFEFNIDTPGHINSQGQDTSPEFAGSHSDDDNSGLEGKLVPVVRRSHR